MPLLLPLLLLCQLLLHLRRLSLAFLLDFLGLVLLLFFLFLGHLCSFSSTLLLSFQVRHVVGFFLWGYYVIIADGLLLLDLLLVRPQFIQFFLIELLRVRFPRVYLHLILSACCLGIFRFVYAHRLGPD